MIASKTSSGDELIEHLKNMAADGGTAPEGVVATCSSPSCPQADGTGAAPREARERASRGCSTSSARQGCSAPA